MQNENQNIENQTSPLGDRGGFRNIIATLVKIILINKCKTKTKILKTKLPPWGTEGALGILLRR